MKFFTRERYLALQNKDEAASAAADAAWEEAVERYEAHVQSLRPELTQSAGRLLDEFYLHDARVLSIGEQGDRFTITLQLDVPPHDLLTITYLLAGRPELDKQFRPGFPWSPEAASPLWLYDELDRLESGPQASLAHSILFSNGWVLTLPFRDVQLTTASPVFPVPRLPVGPSAPVVPAS
jgi:hypothetical protein